MNFDTTHLLVVLDIHRSWFMGQCDVSGFHKILRQAKKRDMKNGLTTNVINIKIYKLDVGSIARRTCKVYVEEHR